MIAKVNAITSGDLDHDRAADYYERALQSDPNNTNAMGWKLVSQLLIRKCNNNELPEELQANAHFYYGGSIM